MSSKVGSPEDCEISLSVSDQSQLPSLRDWLLGQGNVEVVLTPATVNAGEQGGLDVLTLIASSSSLIAAIKVLPEFIRSRRSSFRIEVTVRGEKLSLDANNVDAVMPILDKLLGE
jgi:hypothetical protein